MVTVAAASSSGKNLQWSSIILDNTAFQCSKRRQRLRHMTGEAIVKSNNQPAAATVKIVRNNTSAAQWSEW